jgi:hypothetical protein
VWQKIGGEMTGGNPAWLAVNLTESTLTFQLESTCGYFSDRRDD